MTLIEHRPQPDTALQAAAAPRGALRLTGVSKVFGPRGAQTTALRAVDLDVAPGEFVTVVGASGCGKSTMLSLIAGLERPTTGSIDVGGGAALMFQDATLLPWLTAVQNVALALRLRGVPRRERTARALDLLDRVHLSRYAHKRPHELSGGMRQRVALARVLAQDAAVVLMDEPLGALDAMTRDHMHDEIERVWRDADLTVLFVTHNVREAVRLGDRALLMGSSPGRVVHEVRIDLPHPRPRWHVSRRPSPTRSAKRWRAMSADLAEASRTGSTDKSPDPHTADPTAGGAAVRASSRVWRALWPKLIAVGLFVALWQALVTSGWREEFVLPGPATVAAALADIVPTDEFWTSLLKTLTRAGVGFATAIVIGTALGIMVSRSRLLRTAVGSLITGLQTMPSIVWFPLAILLFQLSESAITFVVVLGAAPSIANGIISGIDHVPPAFTRLGRVLGANGFSLYRHIVIPAALPSYVAGLNQGWAFAWRSLMAGELLVVIPGATSLGSRLAYSQEFANAPHLLAYMVVILIIGMGADWVFSTAARRMRTRRGLTGD
jgi:ABC-type nitrate/sulfonate/bicarbonate transport system ATPase subunit/ABC-type nitrate/sulfonate/bicarbonate transport system permease component